jgi:hypothetical protein
VDGIDLIDAQLDTLLDLSGWILHTGTHGGEPHKQGVGDPSRVRQQEESLVAWQESLLTPDGEKSQHATSVDAACLDPGAHAPGLGFSNITTAGNGVPCPLPSTFQIESNDSQQAK